MASMIQSKNHLQLYDYFVGQWSISRLIQDTLEDQSGNMEGIVTFHPLSQTLLHYEEKGQFRLNDQSFDVFRHYGYEFFEFHLAIYFVRNLEERRFDPFCQLTFDENGWAKTHHPCRDDLYQGTFELISENQFKTTWLVNGPEKQTCLSTMHHRKPDQP